MNVSSIYIRVVLPLCVLIGMNDWYFFPHTKRHAIPVINVLEPVG